MNPTFQRLLDQATIDALHATQDTQDYVGNPVARQQRELQLEKFAELIVKECLEACSRANEIRHFVPPTQQQVVLSCMDEIERTFWS